MEIEASDNYRDNGYAILPNFFSALELVEFARHVDRIFQQWAHDNETEIVQRKLVNMHSLTLPEYFVGLSKDRIRFFETIASSKLTSLVEAMFGPGIYFHNTQLFFNPINCKRLPYWHRDLQFSPVDDDSQKKAQGNMLSLHIRIPLIREQGVELVPGTHQRWDTELEKNVRLELNGHCNSEFLPGSKLISLQPGDILIFDSQMIHRGNYDLNLSRKALDLCVGQPHELTCGYLDIRNIPGDQEMSRIANNHWYRLAGELAANRSRQQV